MEQEQGNDMTGWSFKTSFEHNKFQYELLAQPSYYLDDDQTIPSGNWNFKLLTPDGFVKGDFYPEDNDLFSIELNPDLADVVSTLLLKANKHSMSPN